MIIRERKSTPGRYPDRPIKTFEFTHLPTPNGIKLGGKEGRKEKVQVVIQPSTPQGKRRRKLSEVEGPPRSPTPAARTRMRKADQESDKENTRPQRPEMEL